MGGAGDSIKNSGKGGGQPDTFEWLANPVGAYTQKQFGWNIEPLGQITAAGLRTTWQQYTGQQVTDPAGNNFVSDLHVALLGDYTGDMTGDQYERQQQAEIDRNQTSKGLNSADTYSDEYNVRRKLNDTDALNPPRHTVKPSPDEGSSLLTD